jgi:hypothetical protein
MAVVMGLMGSRFLDYLNFLYRKSWLILSLFIIILHVLVKQIVINFNLPTIKMAASCCQLILADGPGVSTKRKGVCRIGTNGGERYHCPGG